MLYRNPIWDICYSQILARDHPTLNHFAIRYPRFGRNWITIQNCLYVMKTEVKTRHLANMMSLKIISVLSG